MSWAPRDGPRAEGCRCGRRRFGRRTWSTLARLGTAGEGELLLAQCQASAGKALYAEGVFLLLEHIINLTEMRSDAIEGIFGEEFRF